VAAVLMAAAVCGVARPAAAEEAAAKSAAELRSAYERVDARFRGELEHLAVLAYGQQWPQLGEMAHSWRPDRPATGSLLFVAPDQYGGQAELAAPVEPSDATQLWLDEFTKLRNEQADALFTLAREAADAGQLSLAIEWATEAVRENPDHAEARRVLGYELADGQWLTPYARRMIDAGNVWNPEYGWISAQDLPRYEAGERPSNGRWIPAQRDARRRGRLNDGWRIRTEHFLVTTNDSLEAAAGLAARLEKLYQVWQQLFAGFYLSEREVRDLFAGERRARQQSRPFRVYYHRDKDDYVAALVRRQPRIAETLGIYFDTDREAHFFAGEGQDAGTLYHEAVHQLFQESRPATQHVGERANFWIVEGIATYFETLTEHQLPFAGPYYTIGDSSAGRLPAARQRLLSDGYYVPLAELAQLGKDQVQERPDIAKLYSQASGLAAFLMDAEGGRYREPLVRYLVAVYAGRDDRETLATEAGRSFPQLDGDYRRTMESLP
jgi:predicted transcriptional regulator